MQGGEAMSEDLEELERRVAEKWAAAAAARIGVYSPGFSFDVAGWFDSLADSGEVSMPDDWPQFPREQWVSYPNKRTAALLLADRLLDFDELDDEQWSTLCLLMHYGGKTRIA
jgi:hypothetical protein